MKIYIVAKELGYSGGIRDYDWYYEYQKDIAQRAFNGIFLSQGEAKYLVEFNRDIPMSSGQRVEDTVDLYLRKNFWKNMPYPGQLVWKFIGGFTILQKDYQRYGEKQEDTLLDTLALAERIVDLGDFSSDTKVTEKDLVNYLRSTVPHLKITGPSYTDNRWLIQRNPSERPRAVVYEHEKVYVGPTLQANIKFSTVLDVVRYTRNKW